MKILVRIEGCDEFETTLDAMCKMDDGVAAMRAEVEAALQRGEAFSDGGGASPYLEISRVGAAQP